MRFKIILILLLFILKNLAYAQENKTDLGKIAEQFNSLQNQNNEHQKPELYIFVSNSMPKQSLVLWSAQAQRTEGTLLLRGFIHNSFQDTLKQSKISSFNIDPEKFQQYHITQVPAVVLAQGGEYDVVYGDTSLEAALEYMAHHGSDRGKKQASTYLKQVRKST